MISNAKSTKEKKTLAIEAQNDAMMFDGTSTARISVTQDGVTKTGTLSLLGGGLDCH